MGQSADGAGGWRLPFPRTRWAILGFIAGVLTWSLAGGGPPRVENPGEVPDGPVEAVDNAVHEVGRSFQGATSSVRARIEAVRDSAYNMSLGAHVKDRISQERSIDAAHIEVQVKNEGTVVLKGQVPDANTKQMAVEVTRDTDGVTRIEDHLSVPPAPRVFAVTTEEDAAAPRSRRTR